MKNIFGTTDKNSEGCTITYDSNYEKTLAKNTEGICYTYC